MAPPNRRIKKTSRRKADQEASVETKPSADSVENAEDVQLHDRGIGDAPLSAPISADPEVAHETHLSATGSEDSGDAETGKFLPAQVEVSAPPKRRKYTRRKRNSLKGASSEPQLAADAAVASGIGAESTGRLEPDQEPQGVQSPVPTGTDQGLQAGLEAVSSEVDQAHLSPLEPEDRSQTNVDLAGGEITGHGDRDIANHEAIIGVEAVHAASLSAESGAIYEGELLTFAPEEYGESLLVHPSASEFHNPDSAGAADLESSEPAHLESSESEERESSESEEHGGADHVIPSAMDVDDFSVGQEVETSALEVDAVHEERSPGFDLESQSRPAADRLPGPKSSAPTAKSGLPGFDLIDQEDLKLPAIARFFSRKPSQAQKDARELEALFGQEPTGAVSPATGIRAAWQNVPFWYAVQLERFKIHPYVGAGFILSMCLLLTFPFFMGHQAPKDNNVPDFLLGVWKTPTKGYEDNSMIIKKHTLLFETSPSVYTINVVTDVDVSNADRESLYTLHYTGDDPKHEFVLSFYYYAENGGLLKFKGQKNLEWKRLE